MYHSITFGDKNTWDDWHLIPTSRPVFNPPNVKTQYIDIPGANGMLDLTDSLTGYPVFENRTGSQEFIVVNDYGSWEKRYSDILNYLHGKRMKAVLEDDKDFYYEGRFNINQWKSDKSWSLITIDYNVYPYKKEPTSSMEDWLWDPFNFETGIIRNYKEFQIDGTLELEIPGREEYITPIIHVVSGTDLTVTFDTQEYDLVVGENVIPNIVIGGNEVKTLIFAGTGVVSVEYQGGSL